METLAAGSAPDSEYQKLYELQDRVLHTVFAVEQEFYLTGGTCLSRFYQAKRYSDDLDFFCNDSPRYAFAVRSIRAELEKSLQLAAVIETRGFTRFQIEHTLQVDFVNDIPYRYGEPLVTAEGYLIDTVENILANKLTAILGRDNPKDIFDLLLIHSHYTVSWRDILEAAHKKAGFANDELVVRIQTFPRHMLNQISCIDCGFLDNFQDDIAAVIASILNA
ncbi:MAG: nucleotidyl transferase AbiEii/AbiGii toxin family protein [Spirochaeta sp.]|nr:nucleotidyl transferase AbiEii/AbiGii toxin family protein [Spirochaeta sp.]